MSRIFLLIDDDEDDRSLFCEAIKEINLQFECYSESNGRAALTKLETNEFLRPDIIFLDINMPVFNGWDVLERLKSSEEFSDIPTIMYSTSGHEKDFEKAKRSGALTFFIKPYDYLQLKKILNIITDHLEQGTLSKIGHFISINENVR
ncbi:MAG TPA: response regulator [Cyclobacteriaceae bacterium]